MTGGLRRLDPDISSEDDGAEVSSPVCYAGEVDPAYMGLTRLREFGADIWFADGPAVSFYGFPYPTRMVVIRLSNGDLFVWSPIELSPALKREVDRFGRVRHLVSPNSLHHLFLGQWKKAYPDAQLYAPPGLRRKRKDLAFDAELGDVPDKAWKNEIDQVVMRGSFTLTEIVFFHRKSNTAIFGDLVQNMRAEWFKGWQRVVARVAGILAPHPGAPRDWRASFLNRPAARAALARILAWPIEKVMLAHGDPAAQNGREFTARAFAWLR